MIRHMIAADANQILDIYRQGLDTGEASFETEAPDWETWDEKYHDFARLVWERESQVLGWAALTPVSARALPGCRRNQHIRRCWTPLPRNRESAPDQIDRRIRSQWNLEPGVIDVPGKPGDPQATSASWLQRGGYSRTYRAAQWALARHADTRTKIFYSWYLSWDEKCFRPVFPAAPAL